MALARALLTRPGLLLFDEPLGALDALTRIGMQDLVAALWQEQAFTALFITHDVEEAVVLADRIIVLKEGVVDLEVDVDLARPRRRTSPDFDRIKELVLERILRTKGQSTPRTIQAELAVKTDVASADVEHPLSPVACH